MNVAVGECLLARQNVDMSSTLPTGEQGLLVDSI
ncbi:Uncharacterised protein [Alysiella crassa]|uniref:Uncharacterized protein n=1 Tax=Alysiella crassa TaxID=153491 RepID=A0A376BUF3_9NEIS|nr:Uncharacterised protein [Alysiella crassa]